MAISERRRELKRRRKRRQERLKARKKEKQAPRILPPKGSEPGRGKEKPAKG
jgi:hypothetical protein